MKITGSRTIGTVIEGAFDRLSLDGKPLGQWRRKPLERWLRTKGEKVAPGATAEVMRRHIAMHYLLTDEMKSEMIGGQVSVV